MGPWVMCLSSGNKMPRAGAGKGNTQCPHTVRLARLPPACWLGPSRAHQLCSQEWLPEAPAALGQARDLHPACARAIYKHHLYRVCKLSLLLL